MAATKQTAPTTIQTAVKQSGTAKKTPAVKKAAEVQPVEKKAAEVQPAAVKKVAYPVTDLQAAQASGTFIQKWIWSSIPKKFTMPKDDTFSWIQIYILARDLGGPEYYSLPVNELAIRILTWGTENPGTTVGRWIAAMKPLQMRDLKAKLQWVMVESLKVYDAQQEPATA